MFKKSLATVLSLAILSLSVSTVSAASDTEKQAEFEAKVKQAVFKLGLAPLMGINWSPTAI